MAPYLLSLAASPAQLIAPDPTKLRRLPFWDTCLCRSRQGHGLDSGSDALRLSLDPLPHSRKCRGRAAFFAMRRPVAICSELGRGGHGMQAGNGYPMLSERSRGWLKYLHRKANTPDDWGRGGHPSPMWDDRTTPPTGNYARFDLVSSSYAVALMADTTPAWRELYGSILDKLLQRYGTYWGAIDWLTQIGHDPQRGNYPEDWNRLYIPVDRQGHYDVPGWTANGTEPWGLQMDPIGADGNLFYKGVLQPAPGTVPLRERGRQMELAAGINGAQRPRQGRSLQLGPGPPGSYTVTRGPAIGSRTSEPSPAS